MIIYITILYLLIGFIIYNIQEKNVNENEDDFFDMMDDKNKFIYISRTILLWFPELIKYIKHKSKH